MSENQMERTDDWPPKIFWLLLPLGIAEAAFYTALFVLHLFNLPTLSLLELAAPLAALVVGVPAWYWCIVLPGRATMKRGMAVGAIGSLIVHPVMWTFAGLVARQTILGSGDILSSLVEVTFLSWLYAGWITTPFGAVTGALLVSLQDGLTYVVQACINREAEALRQREMSHGDIEGLLAEDPSENLD
jgi:hypothetical protein